MRRAAAILVVTRLAHAEPPMEVHATAEAHESDAPLPAEPTPALKLSLEALDLEDRSTITRTGPLELRGDWLEPTDGVHEAATRSWQAHARISHAFGKTIVALDLGAGNVVTDIAEGTASARSDVVSGSYYELGVSLTRTFGRGFISLAATARHWLDRPPLGEGDAVTVMLWIGAHF